MSIEKISSGQVNNIEDAREAANAEKPFRDAAREGDVTFEERVILDKIAEKKGEKVISEITKERERKSFVGRKNVKGVEIVVEWDNGHNCYVLYLPQIGIGEENLLCINAESDVAKLVFDQSVQLAEEGSSPREIFKQTESFIEDFKDKE